MKSFKLLFAYDGSEGSKEALQGLQSAGLPTSVEAVVLTIADTWPPPVQSIPPAEPNWFTDAIAKSEEHRRQLVQDAQRMAGHAADMLRSRFPSWMVRAEGRADSPAWGIVLFADHWEPDLVVLGSQGHSAISRFLIGSVSQQVLTHVDRSVRIIHPKGSVGCPLRLIIGFDGSSDARLAAVRVAERPWPKDTRVRLISVLDEKILELAEAGLSRQGQRHGHTRKGGIEFWKTHVMQPVLFNLRKAGLKAESEIREGHPVPVLLREAKRWHADSLFLGARGLIAIERFLLGSVSTQLAAKTPCTIEIVKK